MLLKYVAALTALVVAAGVGATASPGQAGGHALVIRLISINTYYRAIDKPPKGMSAGDRLIQRNRLRNQVVQFGKPVGAVVGHDSATLTLITARAARVDGSATLPDGTVVFHGRLRTVSAATAWAPVTGGSGRYTHARGTVTLTDHTGYSVNVYRLTLP